MTKRARRFWACTASFLISAGLIFLIVYQLVTEETLWMALRDNLGIVGMVVAWAAFLFWILHTETEQ